GRHAALDRALDECQQAVGPGAELERPRLDVLAMDRLRRRARHRPLRRRRPHERRGARVARHPALLPGCAARPLPRAHAAGAPGPGMQPSALPGGGDGGKPLYFAFQWRQCDAAGANCVDIADATRETYRPTTDDVGHSLRVVVTATGPTTTRKATTTPTVAV